MKRLSILIDLFITLFLIITFILLFIKCVKLTNENKELKNTPPIIVDMTI